MTEEQQQAAPKKSWYKRWWGIGLIAMAGIVVLAMATSGGGEQTPTAEPSAEASEPAAETAEAAAESSPEPPAAPSEEAPADPGIGVPVRDGKFEFTVEGVQQGVASLGDEFLGTTAQGAFTLVTLKVTNIGDEPQTFLDSNVKGIDSQGREVASDSSAGIYANSEAQGFINEINPGNSVTAVVVFDLPAGESLTKLEVQDSAFSGGATINLS